MATEVERLLVRLEVTQRKFERQLADANRTADRRARGMQRSFERANQGISRSFSRMGQTATSSFGSIARMAAAAVAALGVREIARFADAWTEAESQIRAAEQISGTHARTMSELNDIANETRSGLTETAALYARLIRVSGQLGASEEQVAQATRTVGEAFKAGGSSASEAASAMIQLSQALGSGTLMGEELLAIRENAPLLAQALADEFGVAIGDLKKLGEEGQLTSDRVFRAILKGQKDIADAFAVTTPTISNGMTVMWNGMRELVAAFDDGSGSSETLVASLQNIGQAAESNVEAARRFGAQFSEAMEIIGESAAAVSDWANRQREAFGTSSAAAGDYLRIVLDVFKTIISESSGVAALISSAIQAAVKLVADGAVSMANSAIAAVETMINGIISGVNRLIGAVNSLRGAVSDVSGLKLDTVSAISPAKLGRVGGGSPEYENPMDAYRRTRDNVAAALDEVENKAVGIVRRVQRAGETPHDPNDPRGNQKAGLTRPGDGRKPGIDLDDPPAVDAETATKDKTGGKGRKLDPFFAASEKELANLRRQIEMIGMTSAEIAELEAKYRLLDEAKERGLNLDKRIGATGETLRDQIDRQAAAIGTLTEKYEQAQERAEFYADMQADLKDGMLDAIVAGESLSGVLEDLARSLAKAYLQAGLFGEGPLATGGGGLLGGIVGSIFGGSAGARSGRAIAGALNSAIIGAATGGRVMAGSVREVGEHGRELFVPETNGRILSASQAQQAVTGSGGGGSGGGFTFAPVYNLDARGSQMGEAQFRAVLKDNNIQLKKDLQKQLKYGPKAWAGL